MKHPLRYFAAIAALLAVYIVAVVMPKADRDEKIMRAKSKALYESRYVDPKEWAEGRPCAEVRFMCLPESQDKSWQNVPTKDHIEDIVLDAQTEKKYKLAIASWNKKYHAYMQAHPNIKGDTPVLVSDLDKSFFEKIDERRFLENMEQELAQEFPGFWRDVPKKVRYRWIRRAMNKAKRFGWKTKKPGLMVRLCARIGLDFDQDPKWAAVTQFVAKDAKNNIAYAIDYIDWTVFNKTYDWTGTRITDWSMRRAHPGLPYPKKPYPRLND